MSNLLKLTYLSTFLALNIASMAHGSVLHSIGIARGDDASVSYIEHHQYFESGEHLIRYYDEDLQLLLTKELSYPNLPQHPTLKQTDVLTQNGVTIETQQNTALMTTHSREKVDIFQFELTEDIIIDAGFDSYIRENWRSFNDRPVQQLRLAVAGQSRLLPMEISKVESTPEGASFTITPRNWLIRLILPTTRLSYDATRQLSRYHGFSNLKRAGSSRNVAISFEHYEMDTPLPLPLAEWIPVASGL